MLNHLTLRTLLKTGFLAALVAGASFAYAGSTIRITNTSGQPWCLRISEEPGAPVMAMGEQGAPPVELSSKNKLVYTIQPGEVCILQFKDLKDLPVQKDLGLVDKAGVEKGFLRLESTSAPQAQAFCACPDQGREILSRVSTHTEVPNVLAQEGEDGLKIVSEAWD